MRRRSGQPCVIRLYKARPARNILRRSPICPLESHSIHMGARASSTASDPPENAIKTTILTNLYVIYLSIIWPYYSCHIGLFTPALLIALVRVPPKIDHNGNGQSGQFDMDTLFLICNDNTFEKSNIYSVINEYREQ